MPLLFASFFSMKIDLLKLFSYFSSPHVSLSWSVSGQGRVGRDTEAGSCGHSRGDLLHRFAYMVDTVQSDTDAAAHGEKYRLELVRRRR